jgi:lipid-A-disaccharide synthase-like uncharacterized protein
VSFLGSLLSLLLVIRVLDFENIVLSACGGFFSEQWYDVDENEGEGVCQKKFNCRHKVFC